MIVFLAGAVTELLVYVSTRLIAGARPRRISLLAVTAAEYLCWGLIIMRISVEGWHAILVYAAGGLFGMLAATYLPREKTQ